MMIDTDWTQVNPVTLWRDWVVKSEQQWSESMSTLLKQEGTPTLMHKLIDEARMMHKQFSEMAQASLAAANMPSRTDIEMLDERLGRIEDGFAALCAELSQLRRALVEGAGASKAVKALDKRPARTRRPVAAAKKG